MEEASHANQGDHSDTAADARHTTNDKHMRGSREEMTRQVGSRVFGGVVEPERTETVQLSGDEVSGKRLRTDVYLECVDTKQAETTSTWYICAEYFIRCNKI